MRPLSPLYLSCPRQAFSRYSLTGRTENPPARPKIADQELPGLFPPGGETTLLRKQSTGAASRFNAVAVQ